MMKNQPGDKKIKSIVEANKNLVKETIETPNKEIEPENENPKKQKGNKYPIYIGVILVLTGLVLYFSLKDNFDQIIQTLVTADKIYLLYATLCFLGSFAIDALILYLFARRFKKKYYYHQAVANACVGIFYNAVTPSATGGQIMQAYTYKKQGIPISNATSCLVMNFIVYQFILVGFGIFSICYSFTDIFNISAIEFSIAGQSFSLPMTVMVVLGFSLEAIVIALTLLMSYSKHFHNFILNHGVGFLVKIHIVKNVDETRRRFAVQVESFKLELKSLLSNPIFLFVIIFLQVASFAAKYFIPYFLSISVMNGTGFGAAEFLYDPLKTLSLASFHKMVTELIPIPGGAGVSEYFYYVLFKPGYKDVISPEQVNIFVNSSQIIWRSITFYFPLIVSGLVTAFYKSSPKNEVTPNGSFHTYVDLQMETIDERRSEYETQFNTKIINVNSDTKKMFKKLKKHKDKKEDS